MNLEKSLAALLDEFNALLTPDLKKNYTPIIKKAFIPFLISEFSGKIDNIAYLFTDVLTREHIINAGVYYVDNTKKVTDVAAVKKYLSAVGELCRKIIYIKHPTSILKSINDFQGLCDEIERRSTKDLRTKTSHASLTDDDYKKLNRYLYSLDDSQYKQQVIIAIFRLLLLYGFKIGIISGIKKRDYDEQRNIITIPEENGEGCFIIELPYLLSRQIEKVKRNNVFDSDFLFLSESGQSITSDYVDYTLINISKDIKSRNKITTTALSKFAVVNMFLEGINPITISEITGMKDVNLKYCQQVAYDRTKGNTNRYINSKIRNISTYDDFNL